MTAKLKLPIIGMGQLIQERHIQIVIDVDINYVNLQTKETIRNHRHPIVAQAKEVLQHLHIVPAPEKSMFLSQYQKVTGLC
jgi:hypothetical protein